MKSRNIILEGTLKGYKLYTTDKVNGIMLKAKMLDKDWYALEKKSVLNYELVTKDSYVNGSSAVIKGGLAASLLGAPGLLAGLSAKTDDIYWVAVEWVDNTKSLIEMDRTFYHIMIRALF